MPQFAVTGPAGYNTQAIKQVTAPLIQGIKNIPRNVYTAPGGGINAKALFDAYATLHGVPTPIAAAQTLYQAAPEMANATKSAWSELSGVTSKTPIEPNATGGFTSQTMKPYQELRDAFRAAGRPEIYENIMNKSFNEGYGGLKSNDAVIKALKENPEVQNLIKNSPELAQKFAAYENAIPGVGSRMMRMAAPVLRTAGKVLGPVGMAMNAYDAAQYAQESGLGQRLAQGEGQRAEQAFRQRNTQYGAAITPEQARNILENGSPRDIDSLGGQAFLNTIIRQQAAAQAIRPQGPVKPQPLPQGQ
jgi:hypothetical protein